MSIALAADLTVASKDSYFMLPFTKVGLTVTPQRSSRLSWAGAVALRTALLAEPIPASEALALGLIAKVADDLDAGLEQVMATLREGPLVAFARTKHAVNSAVLSQLDVALELERSGQAALLAAPDAAEGVAAFSEKRGPAFTDRLTRPE